MTKEYIHPANAKYIAGAQSNNLELMQEAIDEGAWWHDVALYDSSSFNKLEACKFALEHGAQDIYTACIYARTNNAIEVEAFLTALIQKTDPEYPPKIESN